MLEKFKEALDGQTFDSIEEYNAEILRVSRNIEEDLGRAERILLQPTPEVLEEMGVEINGR